MCAVLLLEVDRMSDSSQCVDSPETTHGREDDAPIDEINVKIEALRDGLKNAWAAIDDLEEQVHEEREHRRRLEDENDDLRQEIDRLHAHTDLLRLVEDSDEMTGKQRSLTLVQHLKKQAETQRNRGREAKASVNREEAESALQYPDVDRTTIYDDMRRAERLVDNKTVLQYQSASGGGSRLRLNLEGGDLPSAILGGWTEEGGGDCGASTTPRRWEAPAGGSGLSRNGLRPENLHGSGPV